MTTRTQDDSERYLVETKLGLKQSLTPEGFLLCEGVPISRVGELLYVAGEVPIEPDNEGLIRITRYPEDVFAPESLASFEGKPVTNDHPPVEVTPENWKRYATGTVQNVRRGQNQFSDCVVADLIVTDADAIEDVRSGKREVSAGYDAEYEQLVPGRGVQRQIVGNHVALVERGRCGPRCSISDHKRGTMAAIPAKKLTFKERLIAALTMDTADEGGVHLHLGGDEEPSEKEKAMDEFMKSCDKRFGDLETSIKGIADAFTKMTASDEGEEEAGDPDKTKDAASLLAYATDSFKELLARAEILAPGLSLSMPTYDAKKPKASRKALDEAFCACKRQALTAAMKTEDGKKAVERFTGKLTVDTLDAVQVDVAFIGATELLRDKNNSGASRSSAPTKDFGKAKPAVDIAARHKEFWAGRA